MSPTLATASCMAAEMIARSSMSWANSRSGAVAAMGSVLVALAVALDATDVRAAGCELLLQSLEAAVEVVDAVDHRLAARRETCDHQAHRGAQVGRHHLGALQRRHAAHPRLAPLHDDVGAHASQFRRVHEAVLEDSFLD